MPETKGSVPIRFGNRQCHKVAAVHVFAHVNDALKGFDGQTYEDSEEDEVSAKIQQIRDIRNAGLEVIHVIQRYGLTEKEAFEVESALIDAYGELTNIQIGHASDRGVNNAEVLQRELSYEEYKEPDFKYTMDVTFVHNGQLTVLPFPFKYLREYCKRNYTI